MKQSFYREIVYFNLFFIIVTFYKFIPISAAPIDYITLSSKKNLTSPTTANTSKNNHEILDEGISYRLDAWSQYDNPEEGIEREGDIHEFPETRKTITRDENLFWPKGVVKYWLHSSIRNEPTDLAILKEAMETIMEKTCVVFEEIFPDENGTFPTSSWVNITGNQKGCFSDVGRSTLRPSNLNLQVRKCFASKGHAMHEILHTLGVYHEHMRPDRDEHIKILWNNIKDGDAFNFRLLPTTKVTTYELPYDYDSVMHYSMTAFAKNKSRASIVPMKQERAIGQRDHLSQYDIEKLLIAYKCNNTNISDAKKTEDLKTSVEDVKPNEVDFTTFFPESGIQKQNFDHDMESLETLNDKKFESWPTVDLLNEPYYNMLSFYVDYFSYFR